MTFRDQARDPVQRLAAELARLRERVSALESRGFTIPIVDDDPNAGDPTNMWAFDDGRIRWRGTDGTVHELSPGNVGGGSSGTPKQQPTRKKVRRTSWDANATGCYCPRHGREGALYYGRWSATHGERRVMFGFNDSNIRSTLSGAAIRKVEIRVRNLHSYSNGGITIHWGTHNKSSLDGNYAQRHGNAFKGHWPKVGGNTWRTVPTWIGAALRDGTIRGLTINQPSGSVGYYGRVAGNLDLRITYVK